MSYNHLDDCHRFMAKVEKDRRGPKDGGPIGLGAARILGIDMSGSRGTNMICPNCQQPTLMLIRGVCHACATAKPPKTSKVAKRAHTQRETASGAHPVTRARCQWCGGLIRVTGRGRLYVHRNVKEGRTCDGTYTKAVSAINKQRP